MYIQKSKSHLTWLLLLMGLVVFPTFSGAAMFHAILVGDTNDSNIGESVKVDMENLKTLVADIAKHTELTPVSRSIEGSNLNRDNVLQAVNNFPENADVVFFYWSGHGFNDDKSVLPTMYLGSRTNGLSLLDVADTIRKKNPRLFFVIGDTCNVKKGSGSRTVPLTRDQAKPENYKTLFLQYRGEVLAAGSEAKEGGYSYGNKNNGGYFTNAFLNSLREELTSDSRPSWQALMKRAVEPIVVSDGIVQQPIANANKVSYIEEGGSIFQQQSNPGQQPVTDCEKARAMGKTCGAPPEGNKPSPSPSGGCTDSNDPKCWGQ